MAMEWKIWVLLLAAGVGSLLLRSSFILLADRYPLSEFWMRYLRYVPQAVFSALVVPALLLPSIEKQALDPQTLAGLIAALVAWKTNNILATLLAGLLMLWIFNYLI